MNAISALHTSGGFKTVKRESAQQVKSPSEKSDDMPYQINNCHAMASDGDLVKERWPDLYTGTS